MRLSKEEIFSLIDFSKEFADLLRCLTFRKGITGYDNVQNVNNDRRNKKKDNTCKIHLGVYLEHGNIGRTVFR